MMNIKFSRLAIIVLAVLSLTSCYREVDNNPKPKEKDKDSTTVDEGYNDVLVINEGNFLSGDGTFSFYNSTTKAIDLVAFAKQNGFPLGATIQTVREHEGKYYAVTNRVDKVEIINAFDLTSEGVIKNSFSAKFFENPFDIAIVGTKAYVTNWGPAGSAYDYTASFVSVINLTDNSLVKTISIPQKAQHVIAVNSKVYVTNVNGNTISVIDTSTDQIDETITVEDNPDNMVLDKDGMIWVICNSGKLVKLDPSDDTIKTTITGIKSLRFNAKLVTNATKDKLFYLWSGTYPSKESKVYAFDISSTSAPAEALITGENFYGVGVSKNGDIYVGDSKSFQKNGEVYRYSADGTKIDTFAAGKGPNGFIFRNAPLVD